MDDVYISLYEASVNHVPNRKGGLSRLSRDVTTTLSTADLEAQIGHAYDDCAKLELFPPTATRTRAVPSPRGDGTTVEVTEYDEDQGAEPLCTSACTTQSGTDASEWLKLTLSCQCAAVIEYIAVAEAEAGGEQAGL